MRLSGLRGRAGSTGLTNGATVPFRNTCSHVPREVLVLVQVRVHVLVVEAAVPRAPVCRRGGLTARSRRN